MTERQRKLQERLGMPEALLSRTDVADLGLPRRGVDAVFRALEGGGASGLQPADGSGSRLPRACGAVDWVAVSDAIAVVADDLLPAPT